MLFFSFFKTLVGKEIVVELKNGAAATPRASDIASASWEDCTPTTRR